MSNETTVYQQCTNRQKQSNSKNNHWCTNRHMSTQSPPNTQSPLLDCLDCEDVAGGTLRGDCAELILRNAVKN